MEFAHVEQWIQTFSYPAVFLLLVSAGFGAPVSEELVMIAGGLVVGKSGGSLWGMIATAWVGVLAGDSLLWRIGHRLGPRAVSARGIRKLLTPRRVAWAQRHFAKHGAKTIFIARFTSGLRSVTFLSAGTTGLPYRKFIVADATAALILVPIVVWLGWKFGAAVLHDVHMAFRWVLGGVAVCLVGGAVVAAIRRRRRVRAAPLGPQDVRPGSSAQKVHDPF
ncbi:MAG: DedA family protein [Myxococcaceae bacterium]|nr:DedA family protein [Myxococcaceae bacterium]